MLAAAEEKQDQMTQLVDLLTQKVIEKITQSFNEEGGLYTKLLERMEKDVNQDYKNDTKLAEVLNDFLKENIHDTDFAGSALDKIEEIAKETFEQEGGGDYSDSDVEDWMSSNHEGWIVHSETIKEMKLACKKLEKRIQALEAKA